MTTIETDGILFDMDGVLVSSIASVVRCWRRFAANHGVPGANELHIPHGTRAVDIIRKMVPSLDLAEGLREIEDIELADLDDTKRLPGATALLASLPPERWTIVSSATRKLLVGRLAAAGVPVPPRFISAESIEHGKPHPEPYLAGAALLGLDPTRCLVVEDAPGGVQSGLAAGARVLAVLGTHDEHDLRAAGATRFVRSLADVTVELLSHGLRLDIRDS